MYIDAKKIGEATAIIENDKEVIDSLTTKNIYLTHENYIYDVVISKMCGDDSTFCIKFDEYKTDIFIELKYDILFKMGIFWNYCQKL